MTTVEEVARPADTAQRRDALRVVGVTKTLGERQSVTAVREAHFSVADGELLVIMGASGSGKSTLLSIAGGLQRPDAGSVYVGDVELTSLEAAKLCEHRRRHVGFVFQNYNLVRPLTALENVMLPAELDGASHRVARAAARYALARVGLAELGDRFPDELSGGEQQRVAIARAVCGERSLLLADEPTGALDSANAHVVLEVIERCVDDGAACVLVTHNPEIAERATRRLLMSDGRLSAEP
jgi:putative ABC transport system ATP-binding protein